MSTSPRPVWVQHCTSEPFRFFGRAAELQLLAQALTDDALSALAFVGPGGQGKTAIVQTWLQSLQDGQRTLDGVFLWSFYRGKDADLCLRQLYAYAENLDQPPELAASYCVDRLLPRLRRERWAIILDGTEVVQHEIGDWHGRFVHPELGRLVEELASAPQPGVLILTSRFPFPGLKQRRCCRLVELSQLDPTSACSLLRSLGVQDSDADLREAAAMVGHHAKAVELLGTAVAHFQGGKLGLAERWKTKPGPNELGTEEDAVLRVLNGFKHVLPTETQDILALATAFRQPPREEQLLAFLASGAVRTLLRDTWGRTYAPLDQRPAGWLAEQIQLLVKLRLLERVQSGRAEHEGQRVLDAHPLVRRGFAHGDTALQQNAQARAGFLHGRPDRKPPQSLTEAQEEVELFHAYCDAGLWNEADGVFVALANPKHRFLAPALERELLLRFFPQRDWRQPPLWAGFGRYRSLAISLEMLGQFAEALAVYRPSDAALRGDALLALGQLEPLLQSAQMPQPWQALWLAYRAHALCLAGRVDEALAIVGTLIPVDVYEWVHVFECLLRAGKLEMLDLRSVLYQPPRSTESRWETLARTRMRLDHQRLTQGAAAKLGRDYEELLEEYDRAGLPWERALTRLSHARWLLAADRLDEACSTLRQTHDLAARFGMGIVTRDALGLQAACAGMRGAQTAAPEHPEIYPRP